MKTEHQIESDLTIIRQLSGAEIRAIRLSQGLSQTAFGRYLNVSKNSVSDWERDVKKPTGAALKLLLLAKNKGVDTIA